MPIHAKDDDFDQSFAISRQGDYLRVQVIGSEVLVYSGSDLGYSTIRLDERQARKLAFLLDQASSETNRSVAVYPALVGT